MPPLPPPPPPQSSPALLTKCRHAATQALLQGEQAAAAAQLTAERTQFCDLSAFLHHSLAEQTARADGLQRSLADALARLEAAQASAMAAAAAAEERRAAEAAAAQAVIDGQRERLQQVGAGAGRAQRAEMAVQTRAPKAHAGRQKHALLQDSTPHTSPPICLPQADAFLAERDQLVGRAQQAAAQLEEETRLHHKLQMVRSGCLAWL